MRVNEIIAEGPVLDKVKSGVKKFFGRDQFKYQKPKSGLDTVDSDQLRDILTKVVQGQQLDNVDLATAKSILRQI